MTDDSKREHHGAGPEQSGRPPLGQILVDTGLVQSADLEAVLEQQKLTNEPLGRLLVEGGYVASETIALTLARQHGGPLKTEYGFALPPTDVADHAGADTPPTASTINSPPAGEPELKTEPKPGLELSLPRLRLAPSLQPQAEPLNPAHEDAERTATAERNELLAHEIEEREAASAQLHELERQFGELNIEHEKALESTQGFRDRPEKPHEDVRKLETEHLAERQRAEELQRRIDEDAGEFEATARTVEQLGAALLATRERADELQRRIDEDAGKLETTAGAVEQLGAELVAERQRADELQARIDQNADKLEAELVTERERADELQRRIDEDAGKVETAAGAVELLRAEVAAERQRADELLEQLRAEVAAERQRVEELQRRVDEDAHRLDVALPTIEDLEAELRVERERANAAEQALVAAAGTAVADVRPRQEGRRTFADDHHVLYFASGGAYRLFERSGPSPQVGEMLELPDVAGTFRVVRLGISPFPNDPARCAFLESFASA